MDGIKRFKAGDLIKDENGKALFRLETEADYNDKFYIAKAADLSSGNDCLIKFTENEDGYKHANLIREGSFRFSHPYIEHVYGNFSGITPDGASVEGVSVEFVEGCDLEEYREDLEHEARAGIITEQDKDCIIFRQILQLLHAMNYYTLFADQFYLHRDIKPKNIMVTRDADIRLVDFDYAHISGSTKTVDVKEKFWNMGFSAGYTSPEVFDLDKKWSTIATELYSAGRTMFYWLNGKHYYTDAQITRNASAEWGRYTSDEALKYGFAANRNRFREKYLGSGYSRLIGIMEKMCASPQEDRYDSVSAVIADMEGFLLEYCGNSVSRYEELFGVEKIRILHDPFPERSMRKRVMTAYRINGGPKTGKPLYEHTVRDIRADGRKILMIYNIDNKVYCIPVQGDCTMRNREPLQEDYRLHNKDVITFGDYSIEFTIEEREA